MTPPPPVREFEGRLVDQEVWIVGDGPSAQFQDIEPTGPVLALNYGFRNVKFRPFGLVYIDRIFPKRWQAEQKIEDVAEFTFHTDYSHNPPNGVPFAYKRVRQLRLRDGVYGGHPNGGLCCGVAALSLALGMGASLVRLFGYDFRVYAPDEAREIFGREVGVHSSDSNHRRMSYSKEADHVFRRKIEGFDAFAREKTPIVNHCMSSNLHQFPRLPYRKA